MTTTTTMVLHRQRVATAPLRMFLSVMAWEVRRWRASRATWILAWSLLGLFLLIVWTQREPLPFGPLQVSGQGTLLFAFPSGLMLVLDSPWNLSIILPQGLLLLLGLLLPFVCADGVARDLKRRTHELLMTTVLPTGTYLWARYLMSLLGSLALALLACAALVLIGWGLQVTVGGTAYPLLQPGPLLAFYTALVGPAIVLVSSVSFALGTLLPRHTMGVKLGLLVSWFVGAQVIPQMPLWQDQHQVAWYADWDPTGALLWRAFHYDRALTQGALHLAGQPTPAQLQHLFSQVAYGLPDLWAWLLPHVVWAGGGLALLWLAAIGFKRFRSVLD